MLVNAKDFSGHFVGNVMYLIEAFEKLHFEVGTTVCIDDIVITVVNNNGDIEIETTK